MKVRIFEASNLSDLEDSVNDFCRWHDVVQISFSNEKHGYDTTYYCAVLYKA